MVQWGKFPRQPFQALPRVRSRGYAQENPSRMYPIADKTLYRTCFSVLTASYGFNKLALLGPRHPLPPQIFFPTACLLCSYPRASSGEFSPSQNDLFYQHPGYFLSLSELNNAGIRLTECFMRAARRSLLHQDCQPELVISKQSKLSRVSLLACNF